MTNCRNADRILLVEGPDDFHVILQLRRKAAAQNGNSAESLPEFCIDHKGGIDALLDSIVSEIKVDERLALGIVMDANESATDRWRAVGERLSEVGIEIPDSPVRGGCCLETTDRLPRVGVWVMPDNQSTGELEDFVLTMLPDADPIWPSSQEYIDGIAPEHRKFKDKKELRAKVHAWLATRKQPGRMGAAIKEGDLQIDGELAVSFADWLLRLFGGS